MRLIFFLFLFSFSYASIYAQNSHTEISRTSTFNDIFGTALGDSAFLRFRDSHDTKVYRNYFILPDGTPQAVNMDELDAEYPISIVDYGDDIYFYHLETSEKEPKLHALILNKVTGEKKHTKDGIGLPAKIIGTFQDGGLNVICASGKEGKIIVLKIHRLELKNEKQFSVLSDLIGKKAEIKFIDLSQRIDPGQAVASKKLFREGQRLVLVIDNPYLDASQTPAKTTLMIMDLDDKTITTRLFFGEYAFSYNTWYASDRIYRVSSPGQTTVEVYDMTGSTPLFRKELFIKKNFEQDSFYIRKGSNYRVFKKPNRQVMKPNFIYVHSNGSENVITLGYSPDAPTMMVSNLGPAVMMGTLLASTIINETVDRPYEYHFSHYQDPLATGDMVPFRNSGLISEAIDKYELSERAMDIDYEIKGYFGSNRVIYAIYQRKKEKRLHIIKFE